MEIIPAGLGTESHPQKKQIEHTASSLLLSLATGVGTAGAAAVTGASVMGTLVGSVVITSGTTGSTTMGTALDGGVVGEGEWCLCCQQVPRLELQYQQQQRVSRLEHQCRQQVQRWGLRV